MSQNNKKSVWKNVHKKLQNREQEDQTQPRRLGPNTKRSISPSSYWERRDESLNWFLILIINDTSHRSSKSQLLSQLSMASKCWSLPSTSLWHLVLFQLKLIQIILFIFCVLWAISSSFVVFLVIFLLFFSFFSLLSGWDRHSWFNLVSLRNVKCFSHNKLGNPWVLFISVIVLPT